MSTFDEDFAAAVRAGGEKRRLAFDFFATRYRDNFSGGERGYKFFCDLFDMVEKADPSAIEEFRERFTPLLDQEYLKNKMMSAFEDGLDKLVEKKKTDVERKERLVATLQAAEEAERKYRIKLALIFVALMAAFGLIYWLRPF